MQRTPVAFGKDSRLQQSFHRGFFRTVGQVAFKVQVGDREIEAVSRIVARQVGPDVCGQGSIEHLAGQRCDGEDAMIDGQGGGDILHRDWTHFQATGAKRCHRIITPPGAGEYGQRAAVG